MSKFALGLKRDEPDPLDYKMEDRYCGGLPIKLPSSYSIKDRCPPVWNQQAENSCTGHSGACARSVIENDNTLELSRAFLYFQERVLTGDTNADDGSSMRCIMDALKKYGICLNSEMPYKAGDYKTPPTEQNYKNAEKYKIKSYLRINTGVEGIKQWLYLKKQGVCFGIAVYDSMQSENVAKNGILPLSVDGESIGGYHALYITGWKNNPSFGLNENEPRGYFEVRNSWGSQWGQDGYFLMPYEYLEQDIAFDFWVIDND